LQNITQMHSYYVTNLKSNINYKLSEQELQNVINQTSLPFDDTNEQQEDNIDDNDDEIEEIDEEELDDEEEKLAIAQINSKIVEFAELIDVNDPEFCRALELDVSVIIPPLAEKAEIENDNLDFDINALVETAMAKKLSQQTEI
jgi:hypothetical protein